MTFVKILAAIVDQHAIQFRQAMDVQRTVAVCGLAQARFHGRVEAWRPGAPY